MEVYPPETIAERVQSVGVAKARLDFWSMLTLSVLAGAFIALGGIFYTSVTVGAQPLSGSTLFLGGVAFSLGLILVVLAGAELFTGNNLLVIAAVSRKITLPQLLRAWAIVYTGNLLGATVTAALTYLSGQWRNHDYAFSTRALTLAVHKVNLGASEAFFLGILANILVCLAVWLSMGGRSATDKILAIVFPVTAFVASGFEHSIANIYFLTMGLLLTYPPEVGTHLLRQQPLNLDNLTPSGLIGNLLPVTLGNMVGGALFVGLVYWFIYLRPPASKKLPS